MNSFATVNEYTARYGEVSDEEVLEECLADASAAIRSVLDKAHVDYSEPTEDFADRLMRVCRSVANRILPEDSSIMQGVTQMSTTAGPYSQQYTFSSSYGTPKLLMSELNLLGVGSGEGRVLHPDYKLVKGECWHDTWHNCNSLQA